LKTFFSDFVESAKNPISIVIKYFVKW